MRDLTNTIETSFPETKAELPRDLQPYWRVREILSENEGVIFMGSRIVVPEVLRNRVLETLHTAHQGTTSMRLRAEQSLYWLGMAQAKELKRKSCRTCKITASS